MSNIPVIKQMTIEDTLYYDNTIVVTVKINYPQISSESLTSAERSFNRFNEISARHLAGYAHTRLQSDAISHYNYAKQNNFPFNSYELLTVFDVTYNKNNLLSLYSDRYEYTGGAHGITLRSAQTWDIIRGGRLTLRGLFIPGYNYRSEILEQITRMAKQNEAQGDFYFDNLEANIIEYFNPLNFYLTDEGIAFYYPLYTIAPYASGIIVFVIPYDFFGDNLRYDL